MSWSAELKVLKALRQSLIFKKPFLWGSISENSFWIRGCVRLKPCSACSRSRKAWNWLNLSLAAYSEAFLKLSSTDANFFDMMRPICWMTENFQSNVLVF